MKKLKLSVCLFLAVALGVQAQEKVSFRYNPPIGEKLVYNTAMNMDIEGEQSMIMDINMVMTQTAKDKGADQVFNIVSQIESIKMDMNMQMMMMSYDSENPDDSNPVSQQMGEQFAPLLKKDINVKINDRAEVIDVADAEAFAGIGDIKSMFSAASFPEQPIAEGESWSMSVPNEQLGVELNYKLTYAGKEGDLIRVNLESEPSDEAGAMSITASGFNLYDPTTFVVVKSEVTSKVDAQGASITNKTVMEKQ
ncbi:DUF6263 family protein [Sphingobacterium chungjuense]|jgi:hypothetical protein|uniref:DUF6263 family protein n=1 Tax=Sphingobacterium chungjuense TaxID=2675553 RepID=UPI001409CC71|nr:DUF6263 family protein [Sphingobacterium chungjuense]